MSVLIVGHPVLDEVAFAREEIIQKHGLKLNESTRLSFSKLRGLAEKFPDRRRMPGGAGPNTGAVIAALGHPVQLVGLVASDDDGSFMAKAFAESGIELLTSPARSGVSTSRSLILVSENGEAATAIALGATEELTDSSLPSALPDSLDFVYVEGRVIDQISPGELVALATKARSMGARFCFSLGGKRQATIHKHTFIAEILPESDLVFGTEDEFEALSAPSAPEDLALNLSSGRPTLMITRGPSGVTLAHQGKLENISAFLADKVIDTTGAGDSFAAGYLLAEMTGAPSIECVRTGLSIAAHEIEHLGSWMRYCERLPSLIKRRDHRHNLDS